MSLLRPIRAVLGVLVLLITLHFFLTTRSSAPHESTESHPPRRANATFVVLCRNAELGGVMTVVQQLEDRFNARHGYPWVLLNDEPFTDDFKARVQRMTSAPVSFGLIPSDHWLQPAWINETKAEQVRHRMQLHRIPYGGSQSYRNMCRFQSGFLFRHELLRPYRYYWRVEPGADYFCDLDDDPLLFMQDNNKTYGFTLARLELKDTVPSLWEAVHGSPIIRRLPHTPDPRARAADFKTENPELLPRKDDMTTMKFVTDDDGDSYNLLEQLRDRGPGFLARSELPHVLRLSRPPRRILLRGIRSALLHVRVSETMIRLGLAVVRRPDPQHRALVVREERADPFFRRYRVPASVGGAVSAGRGVGPREVLVRSAEELCSVVLAVQDRELCRAHLKNTTMFFPRLTPLRVAAGVFLTLALLHLFLRAPGTTASISKSLSAFLPSSEKTSLRLSRLGTPLANATFVVLCRNEDLGAVMGSVRQMEDRFNKRYGYPWTFLNDEPFEEAFVTRVRALTDAPVSFGVIPRAHWVQPEWIDEGRAEEARRKMMSHVLHLIPYGGEFCFSSHPVCFLGCSFGRERVKAASRIATCVDLIRAHELLLPYKYYWRVEPSVKYYCDLDYDPFIFMLENNKTYGFTVGLYEYKDTIMTLWDTVKDFMREHPDLLPENNMMDFISDDGGASYNLCHYWSNFEIGDMDFWRGEAYGAFFRLSRSRGRVLLRGPPPLFPPFLYYSSVEFTLRTFSIWRGAAQAVGGTRRTSGTATSRSSIVRRATRGGGVGAAATRRTISRMIGPEEVHVESDDSVSWPLPSAASSFTSFFRPSSVLFHFSSLVLGDDLKSSKMMTPMRYVVLVLTIIVSLHFILTFSHEAYGNATSISRLISNQKSSSDQQRVPEEYYWHDNITTIKDRRANATIVMLARNSDLKGIVKSMKQMEDRFNKKFRYPYVFLNEEAFDTKFRETVLDLTDAKIEFGLIPRDHWFQPDWIDEEKATAARDQMAADKVIYGGSLPYRNMCRFNSGFFYRHELLAKYKYYWRVEPDVTFFCDLDYDPFLYMQDNEKVYGFTIALPEYPATIATLWDTVRDFMKENPELIPKDNGMGFLSDDGGLTYNRCHCKSLPPPFFPDTLSPITLPLSTPLNTTPFVPPSSPSSLVWSNFEIGDLDFWRGEAYSKFFDHLDQAGGFYYERWGDAPVHSIGAALLAPKDKLHFFHDIGYRHEPFQRCPQSDEHKRGKCWCDATENFDYDWYSCLPKFDRLFA
ncbi:hypothetical protein EW146_g4283 [Bondarzewia mesenterica]|uniref:Glycosyltransferase family 15 protein n=1 Tax=Bondarzewia mesenterica TaxID=1095465 RepID=A0A4S4M0U0_9AGAM|nr:hypothetical protein EW146_g4283 [Bondarzewia mesenterica]